MTYTDPFADLNDQKRREREALLNSPFNQAQTGGSRPFVIPPAISRRDYFAAAALQGLLATNATGLGAAAERAVSAADYLIALLDNDNDAGDKKNV